MFWHRDFIRTAVSMTLGQTYELDLPDSGLLGSLLLKISGPQASGYGQDEAAWRIIDHISKVEIMLDSSDICKSLKGPQVQAVSVYDQGVMPPSSWRNYATNTQYCFMLMNFGRFLHDREFGLDLSRWDNVKLKLTNDADSSAFSSLSVDVIGHYLEGEGAGAFRGYMRTEEWKTWTTVADETKYSNLPAQGLLRRIILQALPDLDTDHIAETNMYSLMNDVELNLKTGTVRVFKGSIEDLIRDNYYQIGHNLIAGGYPYQLADDGIDISLGYVHAAVAGAGSQDGAGAATIPTLESGRTDHTQKLETYEADSPACLLAVGAAPFNTVIIPFDEDPDPSTWLDLAGQKTVELNVHTRNAASAADGTAAIILDRLVT